MTALVLVDIASGKLSTASARAIELAAPLGDVHVVVNGTLSSGERKELGRLRVQQVFEGASGHPDDMESQTAVLVDSGAFASSLGPLLESNRYKLVLASPTPIFRELFGRLAVKYGSPLLSAAVQLHRLGSVIRVVSTIDGGRRESTNEVPTNGPPALVLVAPVPLLASPRHQDAAVQPAARLQIPSVSPLPSAAPVHAAASQTKSGNVVLTAFEPADGHVPVGGLAAARVVVGGGRGMGSPDALAALRTWAVSIGAAFGSSRAPIEAEWTTFDTLIGQTGATISPELYLAFGISGAPQHMAGVRGAKTIVAINLDVTSPLMAAADVAIVADAHDVLGALQSLNPRIMQDLNSFEDGTVAGIGPEAS